MKRHLIICLDSYEIMMIYEAAKIGIKIFVWKEEKRFLVSKQKFFFARVHSQ